MDTESNTSPSINEIDKSLVPLLNGLILLCHDAHDGYMQAADYITSSAYKTLFAEYALQRSRFAAQLANLILDHGGDPDDDGHAMSMFSRGWTNIKPVLMGGDYGAIFTECERSEDSGKNAYERVLEKKYPKMCTQWSITNISKLSKPMIAFAICAKPTIRNTKTRSVQEVLITSFLNSKINPLSKEKCYE